MKKSHQKTVVGVIGASKISKKLEKVCMQLGAAVAAEGWVTLTGGEPAGVMDLTLKGAVEAGGETVGILGEDRHARYSKYITIPIFTNADLARDQFNVLSSDVVVLIGAVSAGTLIEVAYALKRNVPMVLLEVPKADADFIKKRGGKNVTIAKTTTDTIKLITAQIK